MGNLTRNIQQSKIYALNNTVFKVKTDKVKKRNGQSDNHSWRF